MSRYPAWPLGEVLHIDINIEPTSPEASYKIAGVYSFGRGLFSRGSIMGSETSYKRLHRLHRGQVVLSRLKAFEGAISLVDEKFDGHYLSPEFPTFSVTANGDSQYIGFLFQWPGFWKMVGKKSKGLGARRERVGAAQFLEVEAPLPDKAEQRRVSQKIASIIRETDRSLHLREYADRLSEEYIDSILQRIQETSPLGRLIELSTDWVTVSPEQTYDTVGIYSHGKGLFQRPRIAGTDTRYPRYNRIHRGQFIYSKLFGWEGALAMVEREFDKLLASPEFPTFDLIQEHVDPGYFSNIVRWSGLHKKLLSQGSGVGSRRQRVTIDRLLSVEIPLPPLPIQRSIAQRFAQVTRARRLAQTHADLLRALHASVLDSAFTGQL